MTKQLVLACVLALAVLAGLTPSAVAEDIKQESINRAHAFLSSEKAGQQILRMVHFGFTYKGHSASKEALRVKDRAGREVPGHFALAYTFYWGDGNDFTVLYFFCDRTGNVYEVQDRRTSAIFAQPFLGADLTIQLIGKGLIAAFRDQMTPQEKERLQALVDKADAKGLLEFNLKLRQRLGLPW